MKVRDLMTESVDCCEPTTSLTDAAMAMWRRDCGVVPVVQGRKLVGVITDRDICIATATRHEAPERIPVAQVMRSEVFTCRPEEDVHDALDTMREHRVRRLPVVDSLESIVGMLSLNDVIRHAEPVGKKSRAGVPSEEVLETLKAIGSPWRENGPALPARHLEAAGTR